MNHLKTAHNVAMRCIKRSGRFKAPPEMVDEAVNWAVSQYAGHAYKLALDAYDRIPDIKKTVAPLGHLESIFLRLDRGDSKDFPIYSPIDRGKVYLRVTNEGSGKYKMKTVGTDGRPAQGITVEAGPDRLLESVKRQIEVGVKAAKTRKRELKSFLRYCKSLDPDPQSKLVKNGYVSKAFGLDLKGWPYLDGYDAVVKRMNERLREDNAILDNLKPDEDGRVLVPASTFLGLDGDEKIEDRQFIIRQDAFSIQAKDLDRLRKKPLDVSDVQRILREANWDQIEVEMDMSGTGGQSYKGLWSIMGKRVTLVVYKFRALDLDLLKNSIQDLKNTLEHELMHMGQDLLAWLKGHDVSRPGQPGESVLPDRELGDYEDTLGLENVDRDEYHSRPKEFYPWMHNLIKEFRQARKPPFTMDEAREFIEKNGVFNRWKRNNPALWEKAVKEFVKAVVKQ